MCIELKKSNFTNICNLYTLEVVGRGSETRLGVFKKYILY